LYETASGVLRTATDPGHKGINAARAFSRDGSLLATAGGGGTIMLWSLPSLALASRIPGPPVAVTSLAFSPDGGTVAAGCNDRVVRLWDAATGGELMALEGHSGPVKEVIFAPDGLTLATCAEARDGGYEVLLWPATWPR
jgi:WD40 repeat protein